MKKTLLLFVPFFLILGCSVKEPVKSKAFHFTILSPLIKISDAGFLHSYKNELNLQIYSSGVSVLNMVIKDKICLNGACDDELVFNNKFFKTAHYKGFLTEILSKKPIYSGKNLTKTDCGFNQEIDDKHLSYAVCGDEVKFKDSKNRIKIFFKEID